MKMQKLQDKELVSNNNRLKIMDYRGEIKVILINTSSEPFVVNDGDRIAQLVLSPVTIAAYKDVTELTNTDRAEGGFGSTGVK